jgi:alpha-L-rhamnosidase
MLGHIMEWFYSGIGGIRQEENSTAFRNPIIKPAVVGDITNARTSFDAPYGTILTEWFKEVDTFRLKVNIPANSSALIYLPCSNNSQILENNIPVSQLKDIKYISYENGYAIYRTGSGSYDFMVSDKR